MPQLFLITIMNIIFFLSKTRTKQSLFFIAGIWNTHRATKISHSCTYLRTRGRRLTSWECWLVTFTGQRKPGSPTSDSRTLHCVCGRSSAAVYYGWCPYSTFSYTSTTYGRVCCTRSCSVSYTLPWFRRLSSFPP